MLDIIFISNDESNAEENWLDLVERYPRARRVDKVQGILQAHMQASLESQTNFFFTVDGDNKVAEHFDFKVPLEDLKNDEIYVYRCLNPINNLVYGFGAIKIYNKALFKNIPKKPFVDLATSISSKYIIFPEVASETHFFNTPEEAWRGAFRECAKLSRQLAKKPQCSETFRRLVTWRTFVSENNENGSWVLKGAEAGACFGESSKSSMSLINNYAWLHEQFKKT